MTEEEKISEIVKSLNALLHEDVTVQILNDRLTVILQRIEQAGLSITTAEPTRLFAFFEFSNGVILAHMYTRVNHLLIKSLIDKHNIASVKSQDANSLS